MGYCPGDPGSPARLSVAVGLGQSAGQEQTPGAAPRGQSSPSCCRSGLPSHATSFPKEPAKWPELTTLGAPGAETKAGLREGLGEASMEAPVSFLGRIPQASPRASLPLPLLPPRNSGLPSVFDLFAFCTCVCFPPQLPLPILHE